MFVWDVKTGNSVKKFMGHTGKVNAVAMNADDTVLASGQSPTTVFSRRFPEVEAIRFIRYECSFVGSQVSPPSVG